MLQCTFFSLYRRYYKELDGLKLDVGVYMKALEVREAAWFLFGRKPQWLSRVFVLRPVGCSPTVRL